MLWLIGREPVIPSEGSKRLSDSLHQCRHSKQEKIGMMLTNKNARAFDRFFDLMFPQGTKSVDGFFDRFEKEVKIACQPENGIYTVYEMTPVTYQIEVNENGDIIHRRLSTEEVEIIKSNKEVDENEK
jgi:hypothetical protein